MAQAGSILKEMKENAKILGFIIVVALAFFLGARYGRRSVRNEPGTQVIRDTVTCIKMDTIVREKPIYAKVKVIRRDTVFMTTLAHDTVQVEMPIERKVYQEDSLYYASVSGWRPSLDTLIVYPKETTITITNTVKTPPPKWSFGATLGPSVLATPSGSVHAGLGATVGLTYRF